MLQSLDTRHGWTQCSGGQPMQAGACVSVCVCVSRRPRAFHPCASSFCRVIYIPLLLWVWMDTGGSETAGQALRGCVYACVRALVCVGGCVCLCVHMLTHACVLSVCVCVWMSEWLPQLIRSGSLWSWINTLALSLVWPCGLYGAPWRPFTNSRMQRK